MRPTFSIIAFTVLSGTGYGLWLLIGASLAMDWPPCGGAVAEVCNLPNQVAYALATGFVLVSAGLFSSLGHLGQPQRAWRAFSQWRSSWLSREGVASMVTFVPAILLLAPWIIALFSVHAFERVPHGAARLLGLVLAVMSAVTVYCTAQIYASLKPVRAWNSGSVVAGYLLLGVYGGVLMLWFLSTWPAAIDARSATGMPAILVATAVLAVIGALLKFRYWRDIDRMPAIGAGEATGLGVLGTVRSFEQPHTEENYLTREMGFVLARKHAAKLRTIALVGGFAFPCALALLALRVPATRPFAAFAALVAGLVGLFVERWLFFAQARHAVIGYYART